MSDHTDQTTETKAVLGTEMRVAHQRRAGIGKTSAIGPSILRAIGTQAAVASSGTLRAATVLAVSFLRNSARLDGMVRVRMRGRTSRYAMTSVAPQWKNVSVND